MPNTPSRQHFYKLFNKFKKYVAIEFAKVDNFKYAIRSQTFTGQLEAVIAVEYDSITLDYHIDYFLLRKHENDMQQFAKVIAANCINDFYKRSNYDNKKSHSTM